ncbi:DNA polymerase III subunit gamma/tau [Thermodesulfobacteriota bacterium]
MVYEVFARKWRPKIFQDVLGQDHVTRTLLNAITTDRLHHAYLFSGARGVGKTSVARILAKAVNCSKEEGGNPCNECESCADISAGSSMDVQEIDGASNRGIEEIRELRENIKHMPSSGRFRVYIIDEVHMLTIHAFNALLKTLEEPPPHVKFIFATTEPHKVPITILSRCQRFDFKRIPQDIILKQLEKIAENENLEISRQGLTIISGEAEGSMRDAESLLDQVASFSGSKIEDKNIVDILGIIDSELIFRASEAIIEGRTGECIEIVNSIYHFGYDIKEFYKSIMDQFRNMMIYLAAPDGNILDVTEDDKAKLKEQAQKAGLEKLQQYLNILINREEAFRYTSHSRLVLETIMIKLCRLGELLSIGDLLEKVDSMEKRLSNKSPGSNPGLNIPSPRISEPDTQWKEEIKPEDTPVEERSGNKDWEGFLKYVSGNNRGMYTVLKESRLLNHSDKSIKIERGNSAFCINYLKDKENIEKLNTFLKDYYERDIGIIITAHETTEADKKKTITIPPEQDLPKSVMEVIKVFKGELKEEPAGK